MSNWNKIETFDGRNQIRQSSLKGEVRKRIVGVGILSVKPRPIHVSSRDGSLSVDRDSARLYVTKEFAELWDSRNASVKETKEKLHKILADLDSTAYGVELHYKGRDFSALFPHTAHDSGVCDCGK